MDFLIVVDMQNDFIDGSLGTPEASEIVPAVVKVIKSWDGPVICTRDTHQKDYLHTQEGQKLPVVHCVEGYDGWEIHPDIATAAENKETLVELNKPSFGSLELPKCIQLLEDDEDPIESITLIGLCTDICVISNAMILKAAFPEVPIRIIANACAGVTPEQHRNALSAMAVCQIEVLDDKIF